MDYGPHSQVFEIKYVDAGAQDNITTDFTEPTDMKKDCLLVFAFISAISAIRGGFLHRGRSQSSSRDCRF